MNKSIYSARLTRVCSTLVWATCLAVVSACGSGLIDGGVTIASEAVTLAAKTETTTAATDYAAASAPAAVQYVRLEAVSEVKGNPWTSMAEFNLLDSAGAVIPRTGWTVSADSVEMVGENGAAERAIDGDQNTFWHTQWLAANPPAPHTFTVNLGSARAVGGFRYLPRPGGGNGTIASWRFYTSIDGNSWVLVTQGTFPNDAAEKTAFVGSAAAPPPAPTGASGQNPPVVFNASTSAGSGDVVYLQGEGFGAAPSVYFEGAPGAPLQIVNRVASNWLAVQIPPSAPAALILRIGNGTGISAQVKLNAAKPLHLDALQLVPGGAFRLFGRNLFVSGSTPSITIDGLPATLNLARSDENMLVASAPASAKPTAAAAIVVDNGNGSGSAQLDRVVEVVSSASGDPFSLGVGWGSGFSSFSSKVIDAKSDSRISQRAACDGNRDDSAAIQGAIDLAANSGGGVVQLPAGRCRIGSLTLRSRVVVQGAGKAATELLYGSNYAVFAENLDLSGIRNLTLTNSGSASEGPLLKNSTRVFIQNVRVRLGTSRQMYLDGNRNFVISGSDFEQTGSISGQGPYLLQNSAGLVFDGNTTRWVNGAPAFTRIHDSYIHGSTFTRDASNQNASGTVHSLTLDFAYRAAVVENTFNVVNGPVTNKTRNDGETILTEGGGAMRTENLGAVSNATSRTLTDQANTLQVDPFSSGSIPENYGVAIVGGKGAGQTRRVVSYSAPTLTVERDWDIVPDNTSRYATFVWGLEKTLIKNNTLSQNPRGIWLYHTAIREVDVIGNRIAEGGGIYLRAYQNLSAKRFMPMYNVLIARNQVVNTTANWMSYISAIFVNSDARAFGIAMIGIEMRSNSVTANSPNVSSSWEEYAGTEGFLNMMRVENYSSYESSSMPRMLGSILTNNTCANCDVAVRIGTGAGGTTILNTRLVNSPTATANWATTSTREQATDTVIR